MKLIRQPIQHTSLTYLLYISFPTSLYAVSQRSRRFAFVSFRTVEQAISAKQRMTRVHPWKSAISFAHKESQSLTMTMTQPLSSSSGSPAPYGFPDQQLHQQQQQQQQQQQYYINSNAVSPSHTNMSNQNQNHLQVNQIYQQLQQQQQQQQQHSLLSSGGMSHSNLLTHQSMSTLQHQKQQQQDEEEELNKLFTMSVSVTPMSPIPSHPRYSIDSVFGASSSTALDAMVNNSNSSFVPGAGLGIIRPASTGSVNLDGNGNLYNSSFQSPYPFSSSAAHPMPMAMPRPRELVAPHYATFDYQDSCAVSGLSSSQNVSGGVASITRGMVSSPGPLTVRAGPSGLHSPRPLSDDMNLGLDLDYDYELLLSGNPPLNTAERDRAPMSMSLSLSSDPNNISAIIQPSSSSSGGNGGIDFVLRRLCDDTYVPTQPWPVRWEVDAFYCSAVVAQLQQFGGVTTISKLRGFLRSRVNATDNIKSVPLKAMLSGYPAFFTVRSNQVTLAPDPLFTATAGMDAGVGAVMGMGTGISGIGVVNDVGAVINHFPSGATAGTLRGHLGPLPISLGNGGGNDFDLRAGSGLSPSTSPPSPPYGYGT